MRFRKSITLLLLALLAQSQISLAKKQPVVVKPFGPHTLAREQWPPAIAPDFVKIVDKGFALIGDQSGRLAIVDLKREQGPQVMAELSGLGKKIIDVAITPHRIYALTAQDNEGEVQYTVSVINAPQPTELSVVESIPVSYFSEPTAIAASGETLAIGGTTKNGSNQVVLLNAAARSRSDEGPTPLATLNAEQTIAAMEFDLKQLTVLETAGVNTIVDVYGLGNPRSPQKLAVIKLEGNYTLVSRARDMIVLGGLAGDRKVDVVAITMKPSPKVVAHQHLPMSDIMDVVAQKTQMLTLGTQGSRLAVVPVSISKTFALAPAQSVVLPSGTRGVAARAHIAANDKEAYIASDAGNLQVLSIRNDGWQYSYSHTIPRLPVASVAIAGNVAVVAGSDIKVYDVSAPQSPRLLGTAEPGSAVRSVAIAGTFLLALTREGLTLRRLDRPSEVVASFKVDGQKMAYDAAEHKAYVLSAKEKETTVTPVTVSATLAGESATTVPGMFTDAAADAGRMLLSGLSNLALYDMHTNTQIGSRVFPNLAIRDVALLRDVAVITAVDATSKGFLLTINTAKDDLATVGSIDVPQDAVAVAINDRQAVVVGRDAQGKDEASIIDLANYSIPKVVSTFRVLEAASAVALRGKIGLVGGRGLEILNL
jgi:hypothetical protein